MPQCSVRDAVCVEQATMEGPAKHFPRHLLVSRTSEAIHLDADGYLRQSNLCTSSPERHVATQLSQGVTRLRLNSRASALLQTTGSSVALLPVSSEVQRTRLPQVDSTSVGKACSLPRFAQQSSPACCRCDRCCYAQERWFRPQASQ